MSFEQMRKYTFLKDALNANNMIMNMSLSDFVEDMQ